MAQFFKCRELNGVYDTYINVDHILYIECIQSQATIFLKDGKMFTAMREDLIQKGIIDK